MIKKKVTQKVIKKMRNFFFLKRPLLQKTLLGAGLWTLYEHKDRRAMSKPGLWRKSSQASRGGQFVKHKNYFMKL